MTHVCPRWGGSHSAPGPNASGQPVGTRVVLTTDKWGGTRQEGGGVGIQETSFYCENIAM